MASSAPRPRPAKPAGTLLFHPKKKPMKSMAPSPSPVRRAAPSPTPSAAPSPAPSQSEPEGPYQDFTLVSAGPDAWMYDIIKLEDRRTVDPQEWTGPVRLNRKDLRRAAADGDGEGPQAVGPMLGPDGKPVVGADGRTVMVDAEGRPIHPNAVPRGAGGRGRGGRRFQKKTRQVHLVPDELRQLRKEERYPWVLEDATGNENWVASMEEVAKAQTHALFMPMGHQFTFVPLHRWYKFQKKPTVGAPTLQEAEEMMTRIQKGKDPERWLLRNRKGVVPASSTSQLFKAEASGVDVDMDTAFANHRTAGGRQYRAVDTGNTDLFGDDEDEDGGRRRNRRGGDGDMDEVDFEEAFEDDEQTMEVDEKEDEEAKELEKRLQKEYDVANKAREGNAEESDEDMDTENQPLTKAGKSMRKLIQKREENAMYDDSDEEKNPYASSEEEEEEEEEVPPPPPEGPAIQQPPQQQQGLTPSQQKDLKPPALPGAPAANGALASPSGTATPARAASPSAPTLGGHSLVAKRATSPKLPRLKGAGSRATSPLAGAGGSRATSPVGSQPGAGSSNKRKAEDGARDTSPPPPKAKKRKADEALGPLTDTMLVEWLKRNPGATTRTCIGVFGKYAKDEAGKAIFTQLVKKVATMKDNILILRAAYRDGASAAPSPSPAS